MRLKDGVIPTQPDAQMTAAAKGAISQLLRIQAVCDRHRTALLKACTKQQDLETKIRDLKDRIDALEVESKARELELKRKNKELREAAALPHTAGGEIHSSILEGLPSSSCVGLCRLRSAESLKVSYRDVLHVNFFEVHFIPDSYAIPSGPPSHAAVMSI